MTYLKMTLTILLCNIYAMPISLRVLANGSTARQAVKSEIEFQVGVLNNKLDVKLFLRSTIGLAPVLSSRHSLPATTGIPRPHMELKLDGYMLASSTR